MILLLAYPRNVSLHFPLTIREEPVGRHGVCVFDRFDNRYVGEEHDHNRDEEAEDEDGDYVGFVNRRVIGFGPVHLTGAVTSILKT